MHHPRKPHHPARKLLFEFELDDRLRAEFNQSGLLDVYWSGGSRPDADLTSLDARRTIAYIAPSGEIVGLLVQDYVDMPGTRTVPFNFGAIEIVNDGETVQIVLVTHPRPG